MFTTGKQIRILNAPILSCSSIAKGLRDSDKNIAEKLKGPKVELYRYTT